MASIWDRKTYKDIFGKYPDGDHEVLDAVLDEDGVYRVPNSLSDEQDVVQWKYVGGYATGIYKMGEPHIFHVTVT